MALDDDPPDVRLATLHFAQLVGGPAHERGHGERRQGTKHGVAEGTFVDHPVEQHGLIAAEGKFGHQIGRHEVWRHAFGGHPAARIGREEVGIERIVCAEVFVDGNGE